MKNRMLSNNLIEQINGRKRKHISNDFSLEKYVRKENINTFIIKLI